jgi:menaquinone-dependent protoporphyrinogen IX oxidase
LQRALLIYDSKYGSTEAVIKQMALILGPSRYCQPKEFKEEYRSFELVVIGAPVYRDSLPDTIVDFVATNHIWLRSKRVAFFCTSLGRESGMRQLDALAGMIAGNVCASRVIGGRLDVQRLDERDATDMTEFCRKTGVLLRDVDLRDTGEIINFALELKALKDDDDHRMPADRLAPLVEEFLASHNTCTLCTGSGYRVRGTPIEYSYQDGHLYLLSEGGEKFANLLLNPAVSVAIYDSYQGMNRLAGLQLSGQATIVDASSAEYQQVVDMKGISPIRITSLPILLNVIKIRLTTAEFIHSELRQRGYDMKQFYRFPDSSG